MTKKAPKNLKLDFGYFSSLDGSGKPCENKG